MAFYLGIDTSNYTTSVALYNSENNEIKQAKKLLSVNLGEKGLRQSDALFQHTKQLHILLKELLADFSGEIKAVGVSAKPRDFEDSYMPCFLAGVSVAESVAAVLGVPCYSFSHQAGHILAALYSSDNLNLIGKSFIAFHISGGTTEALLVTPDKQNIIKCEIIAESLDLKLGQLIDRVGVKLGLQFPAGKELDKLSLFGTSPKKFNPTLRGNNCCISGIENQAVNLLENGEKREDVARFVIDAGLKTVDKMTENLIDKYGPLPLVFAGGVMSNSLIKQHITKKYNASFAQAVFSSDNASGIAILSQLKDKG